MNKIVASLMPLTGNINQCLGDDLKGTLKKRSTLSIAASSFSIYAFEALRKELEKSLGFGH